MKRTPSKAIVLCLLLCALLLAALPAACGPAPKSDTPPQTGDGWQIAAPAEVGLDARKLDRAAARIRDDTYQNVHSLLVVKDGKLVFEEYFPGHTWSYSAVDFEGELVEFDRDTTHNLASVTKSFTSALVGIALDQGYIGSVDGKVYDYFPDYAHLRDGAKEDMTLEDLLTMRSGLEWNEMELPYSDQNNDLVRLFSLPDPVGYILAKPLVAEPGTDWYYSGGDTNLLAEVVRSASGQRLDAFAAQHLFAPLGITSYEWDFINPDMIHASGNLKLRPRDLAKFGLLFLDGGLWNGQRIISEAWVRASTQAHVTTDWDDGYGYQWWRRSFDADPEPVEAFFAAGWGGQTILVFPTLDMVVVFTGGNYVQDSPLDEIVTDFVLPAVQ